MTSTELRERLCLLYKAQDTVEKAVLASVRSGQSGALDDAARTLKMIDRRIAEVSADIEAEDAKTPHDQRILDAELLIADKLGYSNGVRARYANTLAEVEAADAALDVAVEAAKQTVAAVAAEKPELRGKVGETGCFQIARSKTYKHLILAVSLDVVLKFWRDAAEDFDVDAEQEVMDAISIKPSFVAKHRHLFDDLIEEGETTTVKFVKSAFGKEK